MIKINLLNKNKGKRAQGHVELVLSFVLFVGFVLFILLFLNPLNQKEVSNSLLDKSWGIIEKNISIDYYLVSLIIQNPSLLDNSGKSCFILENVPFDLSLVRVTDSLGNPVSSSISSSGKKNKLSISIVPEEQLYKIYSSQSFLSSSATLNSCYSDLSKKTSDKTKTNYSFGVVEKNSIIFYDSISKLNASYALDYTSLKNYLGITGDFGFIVYDDSRKVIFDTLSGPGIIKSSNVLSREIPIIVMKNDGSKIKMIFNLQVW